MGGERRERGRGGKREEREEGGREGKREGEEGVIERERQGYTVS